MNVVGELEEDLRHEELLALVVHVLEAVDLPLVGAARQVGPGNK